MKPEGLTIAVLGAGPVGIGCAALAASRGHAVRIFSPRGGGTRGIGAAVDVQGLLAGRFPVTVAADLGRAVDGADAVLVVVPGQAQLVLLERLARMLSGAPAVLVAPAASLSPLLLSRALRVRGLLAEVGGLAAPPVAARRQGAAVWVGAIRPQLWLASEGGARLAGMAQALFGMPARDLAGMVAVSLADLSGLAEAAQLLAPPGVTEAPLRLLAALARERDALAAALHLELPPASAYFAEIGGLPPLDIDRGLGQGALALSFLVTLGSGLGLRTPIAEASLRLLEVLAARPLRANATLLAIGETSLRGMLGGR